MIMADSKSSKIDAILCFTYGDGVSDVDIKTLIALINKEIGYRYGSPAPR